MEFSCCICLSSNSQWLLFLLPSFFFLEAMAGTGVIHSGMKLQVKKMERGRKREHNEEVSQRIIWLYSKREGHGYKGPKMQPIGNCYVLSLFFFFFRKFSLVWVFSFFILFFLSLSNWRKRKNLKPDKAKSSNCTYLNIGIIRGVTCINRLNNWTSWMVLMLSSGI